MEVLYRRCAGLDVHKKTVVVCCLTPDPAGKKTSEVRTYGTVTGELLKMMDWLMHLEITHVAMESTGEYWKPLYNLLEGHFEVLVVNAQHIKQVPGRKTDVKDAAWIADLLQHGLLRGSFIPPLPQRDLRDLTRQRTNLVQDRATVVNRLHKILEWANIKLTSVVTDVTGVSSRTMLQALLDGQTKPDVLAELAQGRLRNKRDRLKAALDGVVRPHHGFMLTQALAQLDFYDEQIAVFDAEIARYLQPHDDSTSWPPPSPPAGAPSDTTADAQEVTADLLPPLTPNAALALLDTIPGVGRRVAEILVAEIGTDMSRFPTEKHLASWAKLAPGNNESAGKHHTAHTGHGNGWLKHALVQTAWKAVKVKRSYAAGLFGRLSPRRGAKRAIIAVAHHILVSAYFMLKRHEPYKDLGAHHSPTQNTRQAVQRLSHRLCRLGFHVTLTPIPDTTPAHTPMASLNPLFSS